MFQQKLSDSVGQITVLWWLVFGGGGWCGVFKFFCACMFGFFLFGLVIFFFLQAIIGNNFLKVLTCEK